MTKWNEELTNRLNELAGSKDSEISQESVANIAETLDITKRSAASKLRKEGYSVEKVGATPSAFTDEQTEELARIVNENAGELTYAEIAERLGTDHNARAVQGKILSMELTSKVAPTPPKEVSKTYTDKETDQVTSMIRDGRCLEEIAEAVGKSVQSARGKALSLLRAGVIETLPAQRDRKPSATDFFEENPGQITQMTVEELMEKTGKTQRGVKTILTRRGLTAKDYDGAARAEKNAA